MEIESYIARGLLFFVRRDQRIQLRHLIELVEEAHSADQVRATKPILFKALEVLCRVEFIEISYRRMFSSTLVSPSKSRQFQRTVQRLARRNDIDVFVEIGQNALDFQNALNISYENLYKAGTSNVVVNPAFQPALDRSLDVFVAMPFHQQMRAVYDSCLQPACVDLGFKVGRGDDVFGSHQVIHDIWSSMCSAKHIIADCTGMNANVFMRSASPTP